jgi:hypothetical protein
MKQFEDLSPEARLAISIIRRCLAGEGAPLVEMELRDYDATPNACHNNVAEWVAEHPEHEHVRGFLVANRAPWGSDGTIVVAHSVVGDADGVLRDITPNVIGVRLPFVRHLGTRDEFNLIAEHEPFTYEVPNSLLRRLGII